jgi:hypothetical protein
MAEVDRIGAVNDENLAFGKTTWASGHYSTSPATDISAYDAIDEIVANYMDTSVYPNLNVRVLFHTRRLINKSAWRIGRDGRRTFFGRTDGPQIRCYAHLDREL